MPPNWFQQQHLKQVQQQRDQWQQQLHNQMGYVWLQQKKEAERRSRAATAQGRAGGSQRLLWPAQLIRRPPNLTPRAGQARTQTVLAPGPIRNARPAQPTPATGYQREEERRPGRAAFALLGCAVLTFFVGFGAGSAAYEWTRSDSAGTIVAGAVWLAGLLLSIRTARHAYRG